MIIFNESRKTTDIQRVLLQMKISHLRFVVKQLRKIDSLHRLQNVEQFTIWTQKQFRNKF